MLSRCLLGNGGGIAPETSGLPEVADEKSCDKRLSDVIELESKLETELSDDVSSWSLGGRDDVTGRRGRDG